MHDYSSKQLGKKGEELTISYLLQHGYEIVTKNFSCKFGEIDIIAQKNNTLVFVEVKLRQQAFLYAGEIISNSKRVKLVKTARYYLYKHKYDDHVLRFDVMLLESAENSYRTHYYENAFTPEEIW